MSDFSVRVKAIDKIEPHPNADKLEIAVIGGWRCIVAKDVYKVGELVLYVQPDSLLPPEVTQRWEVLYLKGNNGRVGTIKLRGEWSEGLILKNLDKFPKDYNAAGFYGIVKYEPPSPLIKGQKSGQRQHRQDKRFIRYTDIENIKNWMNIFKEGEEVVITEKIHGANFRAARFSREMSKFEYVVHKLSRGKIGRTSTFMLGSHNVLVDFGATTHDYFGNNVYAEVARGLGLEEVLPEGYLFFGEVYGQGVQAGFNYGQSKRTAAFFDIWDGTRYLNYWELLAMLTKLDLPQVPYLYRGPWNPGLIYEHSMGDSTIYPDQIREGCVIRPITEREDRKLGRVILKAISPAYLAIKNRTESH